MATHTNNIVIHTETIINVVLLNRDDFGF